MIAATLYRLDGTSETRTLHPGDKVEGHWAARWPANDWVVLLERQRLDFFGNSSFWVEA